MSTEFIESRMSIASTVDVVRLRGIRLLVFTTPLLSILESGTYRDLNGLYTEGSAREEVFFVYEASPLSACQTADVEQVLRQLSDVMSAGAGEL
jgi:hypothetical protein